MTKSEQITLYGYQQQQFCKMPCFCIPAYENKRIFTAIFLGWSSSSEKWESELQREGGRDAVFVDMGFYTDKEDWMVCGYGLLYFFLVKTMPFLFISCHIAPNWSLFFLIKKIGPFAIVRFGSQSFFISISSLYYVCMV